MANVKRKPARPVRGDRYILELDQFEAESVLHYLHRGIGKVEQARESDGTSPRASGIRVMWALREGGLK